VLVRGLPICWWVPRFQNRIVSSPLPLASILPSGLNVTEVTVLL